MDRVNNQILDVLSGILIKNIDLSYLGFVTFSNVDVAPDLRSAKVYYSVLGRKKSDQEIKWMIIIHLVFVASGVLLAIMDYIASKTIVREKK